MIGHDVSHAGPDEGKLDEEGIGEPGSSVQLVTQDLVLELLTDLFCCLRDVDPMHERVTVVIFMNRSLQIIKQLNEMSLKNPDQIVILTSLQRKSLSFPMYLSSVLLSLRFIALPIRKGPETNP